MIRILIYQFKYLFIMKIADTLDYHNHTYTLGCTKFFLYLGSNTPRFIKINKKYFTSDEKFKKIYLHVHQVF